MVGKLAVFLNKTVSLFDEEMPQTIRNFIANALHFVVENLLLLLKSVVSVSGKWKN